MWTAFMWGGISASAVVIGALAALFLQIPKRVIGWIMAFGTGTLIGAATFELLGDALNDGGLSLQPLVLRQVPSCIPCLTCSSRQRVGQGVNAREGQETRIKAAWGSLQAQ